MKNKTLAEKAAQELLTYIKGQQLREGERLPNEFELSKRLGVGRNTVREAVRLLASRNILRIKQGSGTFVSDQPGMAEDPLGFIFMEDQRKLVMDLMQIRLIVEPSIAALAAQNATQEDIEQLSSLCEEIEKLIEVGKDFSEKDRAFHGKLAESTQNLVMKNLIPVIHQGVRVFSTVVSEQEHQQTIETHRKILEAVKGRRAVEAEQAMRYHLLYNIQRFEQENNTV